MSDQPLPSAVNNAVALQRLREHGIHSVFDVVREGRPAFVNRLAGTAGDAEAKQLYDLAVQRASGLVRLHTSLVSRDEPTTRALPKLASGGSRERMEALALGESGDFESWFGRTGLFPGPDSVASLFSPASYLVDLYRVAKKLHATTSPYHIDKRRPDLAGLTLSQGYMDTELPTLELVNDILASGIEELTAAEDSADELINAITYPFGLPYDVRSDQIESGIKALGSSENHTYRLLNNVGSDLHNSFAWAPSEVFRSELGLSPGEFKFINTDDADWGGPSPTTARQLIEKSGLTLAELHEALASDRAFYDDAMAASSAMAYGASYINDGLIGSPPPTLNLVASTNDSEGYGILENADRPAALTGLQRMIRLQSSVGLSFEEIDWIWQQCPAWNLFMRTLPMYMIIRRRCKLSVESYAAIIGKINPYARTGQRSFLAKLFQAGFSRFFGTNVDFGSGAVFSGQTAAGRLAVGLGIDPQSLRKIALLLTEKSDDVVVMIPMDEYFAASLYRTVEIPRLAGLELEQGLALWDRMYADGVVFKALTAAGGQPLMQAALKILEETLNAAEWLRKRNIDIPTLTALVATRHRYLGTEDILQFITNIKTSAISSETTFLHSARAVDTLIEDQLSRHVGARFGLTAGTARAMIRWIDKVIAETDEDLAEYSSLLFWNDITQPSPQSSSPKSTALPAPLVQYCHVLGQFALACHMTGLQEQDIALIVAPESGVTRLYDRKGNGTYTVPPLTLDTVFWLFTYAEWRDTLPGPAPEARVHLGNSTETHALYKISDFAELNGWDPELATSIWQHLGHDTLADMSILHQWMRWMEVAMDFRLSADNIGALNTLLTSEDHEVAEAQREHLAPVILSAVSAAATNTSAAKWEDQLTERRRDALLRYYLRMVVPQALKPSIVTPDDLYEYMLLDPQVSAKVKTSRIAEAISSVQLYLHRCREGLDSDIDATALASEMRPSGYFDAWDAYNKRYGTWAGLQRLLRYPASYLDPSLRYMKTTTFRNLEDALSQGRLTGDQAQEAFLAYAESVCQMLEIEYINGYVELTDTRRTVYFLGKSKESPRRHFWRTWQLSQYTASAFSEWHPIDADIPEYTNEGEDPSITVFAGSLRVIWWTWKTTSVTATFAGSGSGEATVKPKLELYANIATLGAQKTWRTLISYLWHNESQDLSQTYVAPYPEQDGTTRLLFLASKSPTWSSSVAARSFDGSLNAFNGPSVKFEMHVPEAGKKDRYFQQALHRREDAGGAVLYESYLPNTIAGIDRPMFARTIEFHPLGYLCYFPENVAAYNIASNAAPYLRERLLNGIDAFLSLETQKAPVEPIDLAPGLEPIRWHGGTGIYFWELFFHAPFLIACRLIDEQRFDEAETWLRRIFSPSGYVDDEGHLDTDDQGNVRFWNVIPLQDDTEWGSATSISTDDPDEIAMIDPMHYKLSVYLRWMQLYQDRGDMAYRQQTRDTMTEAKMWYVQATQLLGRRPHFHDLLAGYWKDPPLGNAAAETAPVLETLEAIVGDKELPLPEAQPGQLRIVDGVFLPPVDDDTVVWWDRFALRLYNLRHGLSLDGQPLSLPLYETPVSPRELQQRRLAADGGAGVLEPGAIPMPAQRFSLLLDRARAAVQQLMQFGATLQGILERRDGDALTVLQQTQQAAIQAMAKEIHAYQIRMLEYNAEGLQVTRSQASERKKHYARLVVENMNTTEIASMAMRTTAPVLLHQSVGAIISAMALDMVPNTWIAGMAAGVGGVRFSAVTRAVAEGLITEANALEMNAGTLDMAAGFQRRREEWQIQANQAALEVSQLDTQINANKAALEQALKQATQIDVEHGYAQAVLDMLTTRFTGKDLFSWQSARLSSLYYQLYDATLSLCTWAQKAYQFDTAESTIFLQPGAWDDRYQGLLAGESLALSLQRMECAYLAWDQRVTEVERTLSLGALADQPLGTLIEEALGNGSVKVDSGKLAVEYATDTLTLSFTIKDAGIADDYPVSLQLGTLRRVKSIGVTLPAVLGAYEDVRAVLSYAGGVAATLPGGCTAVALSRGVTDHGVFNLDLNDSKYLPFEGIPVDDNGTLSLRFPNAIARPQEDMLRSLNDVILHVRYTMLKV